MAAPGAVRYEVTYRTVISYDDVVRGSHNEVRACPASDEHQAVLAYDLAVHPYARVLSHVDYWGTRVDAFGVREPHVALEVVATAAVEVAPRERMTASPRVEELRHPAFVEANLEHLARSRHVDWGSEVQATADRLVAAAGDDVVGAILAIHRFVHTGLEYTPGATYIGVDVDRVMAEARGVCQDYSHLALALCRAAGIPARYVSGYFFAASDATGDDAAEDEVTVQTHAWFEAAVPGWGWWPLDPTNGQQVDRRHIKIGHGRDYDDVPPIRGVYSGPGRPTTEAVVGLRRQAALTTGPSPMVQAQQQQ
mgnify:CR=1 FL=1